MPDEVLVKVEGVSKKFCKDLRLSLWYGLKDLSAEILGTTRNGRLRSKEFWAVDNISFQLRRGECLGLIGHNGAGKSTLLKMLHGIIKPDQGKITLKGNVGALIELGAGFNPILTGRENIYINGAVLGFKKKQIDAKFNEIAEFADIGDFIDSPVQNYSSGMKVRLGFAVASQFEPDILLIDEVLAVGDSGFKIKSYNRMTQIIKKSAVIFVSHSMPAVSRVANKGLLMSNGIPDYCNSNVGECIAKYYETFESERSIVEFNDHAQILYVKMWDTYSSAPRTNNTPAILHYNCDAYIQIKHSIDPEYENVDFHLLFIDKDLKIAAQMINSKSGYCVKNMGATQKTTFRIPALNLADGEYSLTVFISSSDSKTHLACYRNITTFSVQGLGDHLYSPVHLQSLLVENKSAQKYR